RAGVVDLDEIHVRDDSRDVLDEALELALDIGRRDARVLTVCMPVSCDVGVERVHSAAARLCAVEPRMAPGGISPDRGAGVRRAIALKGHAFVSDARTCLRL